MIVEKRKDLLTTNADIICHQVNCKGTMGAGVAKQIRDMILSQEDYQAYKDMCFTHSADQLLGTYTLSRPRLVANIFAQDDWRGDGCKTDYNALKKALVSLEKEARAKGLSLAIPGYIGCGLAGGDWNYVLNDIIYPIFADSPVTLIICYL